VSTNSQPADELVRTAYTRELADSAILYEGMSLADLAHVIELIQAGVAPREAGGELLAALLLIHPKPPLDFSLDPAQGDLYSNRAAYLRMLTPAAGWLGAGRARREATTVAYRIAVRRRLLSLAGAVEACAAAALDVAQAHRATLFPDYTYLQAAQPTTFGHYLLTFVYPLLRDLERARAAFARSNASPAGSGSVNGSRLPLDRERLAQRLGFDAVIAHTRDAMWQADGAILTGAIATSTLVTLDRLAEDLQVFATAEFGLVELAEAHSRASVIMPQKKNPYALAYVRGACGEAIGRLTMLAAVSKSPSGQLDNRVFAYGEVPRALDAAAGAARLMAGVLSGLTVNVAAAARRAADPVLGATDLAEVIMLHAGLDYETAHRVVGAAVRATGEAGQAGLDAERLEAAAQAVLGRRLEVPVELVAAALDPAQVVATRTGLGGAGEQPMTDMLAECRASLEAAGQWRRTAEARLEGAEAALLMEASVLQAPLGGRHPARPPAAARAPGEPQTWDDLFKDLPRPRRPQRFGG
jgi:argininosuccinate lyase